MTRRTPRKGTKTLWGQLREGQTNLENHTRLRDTVLESPKKLQCPPLSTALSFVVPPERKTIHQITKRVKLINNKLAIKKVCMLSSSYPLTVWVLGAFSRSAHPSWLPIKWYLLSFLQVYMTRLKRYNSLNDACQMWQLTADIVSQNCFRNMYSQI